MILFNEAMRESLSSNWRIIILVVVLIAFSMAAGVVIAKVLASWTLEFRWRVIPPQTSELKVYDVDGVTELRTIDWGDLEQGKTYTRQIIIKNTGNTVLKLHLNKPNHIWVSGNWGTLDWDREGYVLNPGESVTATLTWRISSAAPLGSYNSQGTSVYIGIEGTD